LGLSIVRGIVSAHGGRVWIESTPGCGTTVFFTMPVAQSGQGTLATSESTTRVAPPAREIRAPARARVLVVEDDLEILLAVREALEEEGFQVMTAVNGCSAMIVSENSAPDVIVLDLCLPEMDGEEFCRAA